MFSKMKNNWKKAEISGVISRLLKPKVSSMVSKSDLGQISDEVVAAGWNKHPDIFEGKFGTRPHKLSSAAFCLCNFMISNDKNADIVAMMRDCFLEVMEEIGKHGELYELSKTDEFILEQPVEFLHVLDP